MVVTPDAEMAPFVPPLCRPVAAVFTDSVPRATPPVAPAVMVTAPAFCVKGTVSVGSLDQTVPVAVEVSMVSPRPARVAPSAPSIVTAPAVPEAALFVPYQVSMVTSASTWTSPCSATAESLVDRLPPSVIVRPVTPMAPLPLDRVVSRAPSVTSPPWPPAPPDASTTSVCKVPGTVPLPRRSTLPPFLPAAVVEVSKVKLP